MEEDRICDVCGWSGDDVNEILSTVTGASSEAIAVCMSCYTAAVLSSEVSSRGDFSFYMLVPLIRSCAYQALQQLLCSGNGNSQDIDNNGHLDN